MRSKPIVIVFMVISALLVAAVYSLSTFVVFAAPPFTGFITKCDQTFYNNGKIASERCCLKLYVKGKLVSDTCAPWTCYDRDGNVKKCKNTLTKGQPGYPVTTPGGALQGNGTTNSTGNPITTSGGALQGNGTTNSNNNTMPLRLNATLNATSSTNPNPVLKDDGLMTRPQKGGPIKAAPPVSDVVVTVTFNSITVHDSHDFGYFNDGEYDLVAYVQGKKVDLTAASVHTGLYDVGDGDTINFKPGTQVITKIPNTVPLSIFTVGTEVDDCGRGRYPDNMQQTLPIFSDSQPDWSHAIDVFQLNSYQRYVQPQCSSLLGPGYNDILGLIKEFYDPPGYGAGPHEVKSDYFKDFTLRYTISTGNACNASIC